MNYRTTLRVTTAVPDQLVEVFQTEPERHQRSSWCLKKEGEDVIFEISASDSVALRATLNGITKSLTVFEKTCRVGEEHGGEQRGENQTAPDI